MAGYIPSQVSTNLSVFANVGSAQQTTLVAGQNPFKPSIENFAGRILGVKGIDMVDGRLLAVDSTIGALKQSTNWASTWSASKTLPTNVVWSDVAALERFGAYIYLLAKDGTSGLTGVYRALPQAGDTAFSWSAPLKTFVATATYYPLGLTSDSSYIYAAEYGDPASGPTVYRSADGVTWTTVYGPDPTWRHVHHIAADPYNPGHVWMSGGDGVSAPIKYSTDYGATWTALPARSGYTPQVVQISFSPQYIYMGGDSTYCTAFVVDRTTKMWFAASPNWHGNLAIPGNVAGNVFDPSTLYGIVDPTTGVYYCAAPTSGPWPVSGVFVIPGLAANVSLLSYNEAGGRMFIANNNLWFGGWHRPLLSVDAIS